MCGLRAFERSKMSKQNTPIQRQRGRKIHECNSRNSKQRRGIATSISRLGRPDSLLAASSETGSAHSGDCSAKWNYMSSTGCSSSFALANQTTDTPGKPLKYAESAASANRASTATIRNQPSNHRFHIGSLHYLSGRYGRQRRPQDLGM